MRMSSTSARLFFAACEIDSESADGEEGVGKEEEEGHSAVGVCPTEEGDGEREEGGGYCGDSNSCYVLQRTLRRLAEPKGGKHNERCHTDRAEMDAR